MNLMKVAKKKTKRVINLSGSGALDSQKCDFYN